jgi:hypothetical protein
MSADINAFLRYLISESGAKMRFRIQSLDFAEPDPSRFYRHHSDFFVASIVRMAVPVLEQAKQTPDWRKVWS